MQTLFAVLLPLDDANYAVEKTNVEMVHTVL